MSVTFFKKSNRRVFGGGWPYSWKSRVEKVVSFCFLTFWGLAESRPYRHTEVVYKSECFFGQSCALLFRQPLPCCELGISRHRATFAWRAHANAGVERWKTTVFRLRCQRQPHRTLALMMMMPSSRLFLKFKAARSPMALRGQALCRGVASQGRGARCPAAASCHQES